MRKKLIKNKLFLLTIALLFTTPAWAEWEKICENVNTDYYIDFDAMPQRNGYVYAWVLENHIKTTEFGDMSSRTYNQVDCDNFRTLILSAGFYKQHYAVEQSIPSFTPEPQWDYPPPNTCAEDIVTKVCKRPGK